MTNSGNDNMPQQEVSTASDEHELADFGREQRSSVDPLVDHRQIDTNRKRAVIIIGAGLSQLPIWGNNTIRARCACVASLLISMKVSP